MKHPPSFHKLCPNSRNGPGVGLLAGDVAGLHRKQVIEFGWYTMWSCQRCGDGITNGHLCLPCEIEIQKKEVDREINRA